MELTDLEHEILDWIARNSHDDRLRDQLRQVEATAREFTGVGSFTTLQVPSSAPRVEFRVSPIDPSIEGSQLEHGGGSVLFFNDGHASTLELYANGDCFPELIGDWHLVPESLPDSEGG